MYKAPKLLIDLIREKVHLGPENPNGWMALKCQVCNDHSERAGFINDGGFTSFNDFNCGAKFKYEEGSGKFNRNIKHILESFGITSDDLNEISNSIFFANVPKEEKEITLKDLTKVKLFTPEVDLPDKSYPLGHNNFEEIQEPLIQYLLDRKIDPLEIQAYFSVDAKFIGRVIIPYFRNGKIIYWQARHINNGVKPRYLNCYAAKDAIIYGYDKLVERAKSPLFITEGVFDAALIGGVCILGSTLNKAKIEILKKTNRRIMFVIDRDKTGKNLAEAALENGWEITFVDVKATDINDSIIKFGREYTAFCLLKNATNKIEQKYKSHLSLDLGMLEAKIRRNKWMT